MDLILYLISLLLPAPLLVYASYLLRYRVLATHREKKGSMKSISTRALMTGSRFSLPFAISPKLTPVEKRKSTASPRMSRFFDPTLSFSNSGNNRRHTMHTTYDLRDLVAEEAMHRTLARRSSDVWIESGHAVEGGGLLARATEMLKPVPAMRVLSSTPRGDGVLKRLRGEAVSMLPNRLSGHEAHVPCDQEVGQVQKSPIRSRVTSSSKMTAMSDELEELDMDTMLPGAQMTTKIKRKLSTGISLESAGSEGGPGDGYDMDWLTSGILPKCVNARLLYFLKAD